MILTSGGPQKFMMSAMAACLVATTIMQGSYARHHKNADTVPVDNQVSMEIFPIQRGYDGAQFIVTKAGYTVSIPGLGVAPNATQIAAYRDEFNNIWYIDRNGAPVKLTDEQVQWGAAQINQQAQARALATGQPVTQPGMFQQPSSTTVVVQQPAQTSSGSGVGSVLATGLAAAGGAFAGAALSNSMYRNNYYGIPYGVPVYHSGNRYYYNGSNGKKVYINNSSKNISVNQWNHQSNWQNTQNQINHHTNIQNKNNQINWQNNQHNQNNWQNHNHPTTLPAKPPAHANFPTQLPAHGSAHFAGASGSVNHHQQMPTTHPSSAFKGGGGHAGFSGGGAHGGFSGGGSRGGKRR